MITFAEARRIVEASAPDIATEPYGYEDDTRWYPVIAPERIGIRVPVVSKATGKLDWISSNSDAYGRARVYGQRP